ncbi:MAG: DUF4339 domain-containing protein [Nitrospirota bacterium]
MEGYWTKKDSLRQARVFSSLIILFLAGIILLNIDLKRTYRLKLRLITIGETAAKVGAFYLLDGSPKVNFMINRFIEKSGLKMDSILIKTDTEPTPDPSQEGNTTPPRREAQTCFGGELRQKGDLVITVFLNKKINLITGRILGFSHQRIHTSAVAYHPPLQWYVLANKEYGPVSLEELKNWCEQERVLPDTLVKKSNEEYRCAKDFKELREMLSKIAIQDIEEVLPQPAHEEEKPLIPDIIHGIQSNED